MVLAVFAALQRVGIGIVIVKTATNAYPLDYYIESSGEASTWVMASRNWSRFTMTYTQNSMGHANWSSQGISI